MILDTLFRKFIWCRRVRSTVLGWRIRFWSAVEVRAARRKWYALVDNCIDYDLEPLWSSEPTNIPDWLDDPIKSGPKPSPALKALMKRVPRWRRVPDYNLSEIVAKITDDNRHDEK